MIATALNHISEGVTESEERCAACDEYIELGESGLSDHHCSEEFESAVEELNRLAADDACLDNIPFRKRLRRLGYLSD